MRRLVVVVLVAGILGVGSSTGVALADDCSSPSDCSNTAWTVGGGAAAAAAIVAAAAAAGWLPGPESEAGLSPECREALTRLARPIRDLHERMVELVVAQRGAFRRYLGALQESALFREKADSVLAAARDGNYDWKGAMDAVVGWGNTATAAGVATAGGEHFARAAAEAAKTAALAESRSLAAQAAALRNASGAASILGGEAGRGAARLSGAAAGGARQVFAGAAQLEQGQLARLATLQRIRAQDLARQAGRLSERAAASAVEAGSVAPRAGIWAQRLNAAGRALGVYSALSTAWGLHQSGNRNDALRVAGILQFRGEAAKAAAERWRSFLDELADRENQTRAALARALADYDARAAECGAKPIEMEAYRGLLEGFSPEGMDTWHPEAKVLEVAPPSVLERGPEPLDEQSPVSPDCDAYPGDLAAYEQELAEVRASLESGVPTASTTQAVVQSTDLSGWAERLADLNATIALAEVAYRRIEDRFLAEVDRQRGSAMVSGTASALALATCVTPPVAIALGIVSLASGLYSLSATPDEWNTIYVGRAAAALEELRRKRGYAQVEVQRLAGIARTRVGNLQVTYRRLSAAYDACDGAAKGWSRPSSPLDLRAEVPFFPGQVRTLKEIESWR